MPPRCPWDGRPCAESRRPVWTRCGHGIGPLVTSYEKFPSFAALSRTISAETLSPGQVAEITPEQDFGFLLTKEGGLLYFHRNSLLSGDFDGLKGGEEVYYNEDVGDTGPIATKVRVKG